MKASKALELKLPLRRPGLPSSLQRLTFDFAFNQVIDFSRLPKSLKYLVLPQRFNEPLDGLELLEHLEEP